MRKILLLIGLIAGILFIVGSAIMSIAFGLSFGNISGLCAGILLVSAYFIYPKLSKWLQNTINAGLLLLIAFYTVMIVFIAVQGYKDTTTFKEDCILVLGCGIKGERILPLLQARLDKCIEYAGKNPSALIILSGGQGRNETIPEAEAMKCYLVSKGMNPAQIIKEEQSRNTSENMQFTKQITDSCFSGKPNYSVVCITSNYHAYRASKLTGQYQINATCYNSGIKWYLAPSAYFREVLSIVKFWIQ